jgi:peptidoglycan hydrolase-like protein with peptidoglycan-binding domain
MPLRSYLFSDSDRLDACLVQDQAHVKQGDSGDHVEKIQVALAFIDGLQIDGAELAAKSYGPSTAAAVLSYKSKRSIINPAYQATADDIVGKMTIAALDQDLIDRQTKPKILPDARCTHPIGNNRRTAGLGPPPKKVPLDILAMWNLLGKSRLG